MTVQIEELLKAFELNNPYLKFYLNKNDGHMALVTEIPGDDKAENEVTAHPDAYIKLPTQADLDPAGNDQGLRPHDEGPQAAGRLPAVHRSRQDRNPVGTGIEGHGPGPVLVYFPAHGISQDCQEMVRRQPCRL